MWKLASVGLWGLKGRKKKLAWHVPAHLVIVWCALLEVVACEVNICIVFTYTDGVNTL